MHELRSEGLPRFESRKTKECFKEKEYREYVEFFVPKRHSEF